MNKEQKDLLPMLPLVAAAAVIILAGMVAPANAQVAPATLGNVDAPAIVNPVSVSNLTTYIPVYKDSGLALSFSSTSSAGNSNAVIYLAPSVDGTNAASEVWVWTQPASATTTVRTGVTNWSADELRGFAGIFVLGITNGHGTGVLTNRGFVFRRPSP